MIPESALAGKGNVKWKIECRKWAEQTMAKYGTLAWNFIQDRPRTIWGLDLNWVWCLIHEANMPYFENTPDEIEIEDLLINNGISRKKFAPLSYPDRFYALFRKVWAACEARHQNTLDNVWQEFRNLMKGSGIHLNTPEEFVFTDEFWYVNPDDLELDEMAKELGMPDGLGDVDPGVEITVEELDDETYRIIFSEPKYLQPA